LHKSGKIKAVFIVDIRLKKMIGVVIGG